jgi:hypothetical protein
VFREKESRQQRINAQQSFARELDEIRRRGGEEAFRAERREL